MECVYEDKLKHVGECQPKTDCVYTMNYDPVCGVNG